MVATISSDEAAAITGLKSARNVTQILTGSVCSDGVAMKIASTTSSQEIRKAKSPPATMPGRIDGRVIRQIAPNFVNTAVEIVKASSLLSAIGVGELLLTTQEIIGRTFMTMEFYALAGAIYLAVNLAIGAGGWWVERRFGAR